MKRTTIILILVCLSYIASAQKISIPLIDFIELVAKKTNKTILCPHKVVAGKETIIFGLDEKNPGEVFTLFKAIMEHNSLLLEISEGNGKSLK